MVRHLVVSTTKASTSRSKNFSASVVRGTDKVTTAPSAGFRDLWDRAVFAQAVSLASPARLGAVRRTGGPAHRRGHADASCAATSLVLNERVEGVPRARPTRPAWS